MRTLPGDPWIRYRDTGLYAVPGIHHRLVFAQLVLEACRRKRFDVIAVELPGSLSADWLKRIAGFAPATGMLLDSYGAREQVRLVQEDDADAAHPRRVLARNGLALPITPADSIIAALRCPRLLAPHWKDWQPEVVAVDMAHAPVERPASRLRVMDDYEVAVRGLSAFQERWNEAWLGGRVDPLDGLRERRMASHLARFIAQGQDVLFVCGAGHWHPITRLLDDDMPGLAARRSPATAPRGAGRRLHLVNVDPRVAWLWGWLDDIPAVVWEYERACVTGTSASWDKREATRRLVTAGVGCAQRDRHPASLRRLAKMDRYGRVLLAAAGRWTPELDNHLIHSAETCVSRGFARRLKELSLEYPAGRSDAGQSFRLLETKDGRLALRVGDEYFLFKPVDPGVGSGRRLPLRAAQRLTAPERVALTKSRWVYRDWPPEQALHNRLLARARLLAHRQSRDDVARPFTAGMGHGVSVRHTLRAWAAGRPDAYVRHARPRRHDPPACDGRCPVVWILDATAPIVTRFHGYVPREAHSYRSRCISAFYWTKGAHELGDSHIQQYSVAYTVSLMRGLMPPGQRRNAATVASVVGSFPPHRRATIAPWDDASLRAFHGCDLAVASAVKYAGDHVIVVSRSSHGIGAEVESFARDRRVRIIRLRRDGFEPSALERLGLDHNVPAPTHWGLPFEWCGRFIPEVEC